MSTPAGTVKLGVNADFSQYPAATLTDNGDGTSSGTVNLPSGLPTGNFNLAGAYQGDANHNPSTSPTTVEEVDSGVANTVTSIAVTPNPAIQNQPIAVKITVANQPS